MKNSLIFEIFNSFINNFFALPLAFTGHVGLQIVLSVRVTSGMTVLVVVNSFDRVVLSIVEGDEESSVSSWELVVRNSVVNSETVATLGS